MSTHLSVLTWRIHPMDREAWWATVHGVEKSWTRLSDLALMHRRGIGGRHGYAGIHQRFALLAQKAPLQLIQVMEPPRDEETSGLV